MALVTSFKKRYTDPNNDLMNAVLSVSQSVVAVITHNVTGSMARSGIGILRNDKRKFIIWATGIIIESELGDTEGTYHSTILAPASLFSRNYDISIHELQIDVYDSGGKLFKGEVLACDFNYNLSAIRILSDSPLPTESFRYMDYTSIEHYEPSKKKQFQLIPHSSSSKIFPGSRILTLRRRFKPPCNLEVYPGVVCTHCRSSIGCQEILWIDDTDYFHNGGPVLNCLGELIGIYFKSFCFLPSNFVTRWWSHYKSCREFIRPWLGLKISNIQEMEHFAVQFPNILTGIVVKKVEEKNSSFLDLQPNDVILKCAGKVVRNKLEFLEIIWDNAGEVVELNVQRASDGTQWNESITIGKRDPNNLYWWPLPMATVYSR